MGPYFVCLVEGFFILKKQKSQTAGHHASLFYFFTFLAKLGHHHVCTSTLKTLKTLKHVLSVL